MGGQGVNVDNCEQPLKVGRQVVNVDNCEQPLKVGGGGGWLMLTIVSSP